jgi:hypothetical protein
VDDSSFPAIVLGSGWCQTPLDHGPTQILRLEHALWMGPDFGIAE